MSKVKVKKSRGGGSGAGDPPKKTRWSQAEEMLLLNIINTGDKGLLRKVLVDQQTCVKLAPFGAWEQVM